MSVDEGGQGIIILLTFNKENACIDNDNNKT